MRVTFGGRPLGPLGDDAARVDRRRAARFLRTQSAFLHDGLARADDRTAVGVVLGMHDASHESWLALLGALGSEEPGAHAVAALYAYHGRVVGYLEGTFDRELGQAARAAIRARLSARLRELTDAAVAGLEGRNAGTGAPPPLPGTI